MRLNILLLLSITALNQSLAATSVGTAPLGTPPGTGICDYTTIQEALNSGATGINVLNDQEFLENLIIDHAVVIVGGYASCQDANFNLVPTEINTTIKGTEILGESVIRIETDDNPTIKLINLNLQSATVDDSVPNGGHGIKIDQSSGNIWLVNINIGFNNSDVGAGIYMNNTSAGSTTDVSLFLEDTAVSFNTANSAGGGVFCSGEGAELYVFEDSFIGANVAINGGGVYAESDCYMVMASGVNVHNSSEFRGLMYNNASGNGGAVYSNAARISLDGSLYGYPGVVNRRDSTTPVTIAKNTAGDNGGGIFATNGSFVTVRDSLIEGNTAATSGGAFYTKSSTLSVNSGQTNFACWNQGACMEISNNKATFGGVIFVSLGAIFKLENAFVSGNRADLGTVGYAHEVDSFLMIYGSYLYNNGNNGEGAYEDSYVLQLFDFSTLDLKHSTLADNDINDSSAIIGSRQSQIALRDSIIHNDELVFEESEVIFPTIATCLVVNEDNSISGSEVYVGDPGFVDSNNQNYHIRPNYLAVDLCESHANNPYYDTDGDPRVWDEPFHDNIGGSLDAGADEYFVDLIFDNGFED